MDGTPNACEYMSPRTWSPPRSCPVCWEPVVPLINNNESFLSTRSFLMMKSELLYQTFWTLAGQAETSEHFSKMFAHQKKDNSTLNKPPATNSSFCITLSSYNYKLYKQQITNLYNLFTIINKMYYRLLTFRICNINTYYQTKLKLQITLSCFYYHLFFLCKIYYNQPKLC
ncbi:uncharacterized protein isoform X1 [Rhodnius prolixus]|uniref:uncharacterized protein isoform X1 n=1 Tax=Rhodnius prolixus TaxID=13249 RepID=UPI003D18E371